MLHPPLNLHGVCAQTPRSVNPPSGGVGWKVTTLTCCCSNSSTLKFGSCKRSEQQQAASHTRPAATAEQSLPRCAVTSSLQDAQDTKKTLHLCRASEIYTLCIVFRAAFKCSQMKDCWLTEGKTLVTERPWNKGRISQWMTSRLTHTPVLYLHGSSSLKRSRSAFRHIKEYKSIISVKGSFQGTERSHGHMVSIRKYFYCLKLISNS